MSDQAFCTSCGTQLKEGAKFCTNCGSSPRGKLQMAAAPSVRKNIFKQWWFWVALTPVFVISLIFIAATVGGKQDASKNSTDTSSTSTMSSTVSSATSSPTSTAPAVNPEPAKPKVPSIGSGTFQVGTDVQPGLYKADDGVTYWARLKGFSGGLGDIIANGTPQGQVYVEINASDKGFQNQGTSDFVKIDPETYRGDQKTSFSDGMFMVGKDIQPGTYKGQGSGYWARLSRADGALGSVIANETPDGSAVVQIAPSDKFFDSFGMTWTKVN